MKAQIFFGAGSRSIVFISMIFWGATLITGLAEAAPKKIPNGIKIEASEFPAVLSLNFFQGRRTNSFCSGTAIAPHRILTAAHCAFMAGELQEAFGNGSVFAENGDDRWIVGKSEAPPGAFARPIQSPSGCPPGMSLSDGITANTHYCLDRALDVAILHVEAQLGQIMDLDFSPPRIGEAVELVGYGINDGYLNFIANLFFSSGVGVKRKGSNFILDFNPDYIGLEGLSENKGFWFWQTPDGQEATAASGDSGSPLLRGNRIIGVASAASVLQSDDEPNNSIYVRVDGLVRPLIENALRSKK